MAASNFDACLAFTLKYEGGFVDHPSDPGGATNMGITIGTLSAWRGRKVSKADVRALTKGEAATIYRKRYWDAVRGDVRPAGLDLVLFDYGVNSGPAAALKQLDRVSGNSVREIIKGLCARRISIYRGLKTWSVFGKGWARRIAACEARALAMAGALPADLMAEARASEAATKRDKAAGGALAGAGGLATTQAPAAGIDPLVGAAIFLVVLLIGGGLLWLRIRRQSERADAMADEARQ